MIIRWLLTLFFCFIIALNGQNQKTNLPYTVLISFDGFRWDYPLRGLTPNLDSIKKHGVHALSFRPVYPSKTFPNHYSIVSGMYPENHGIISNNFQNPFDGETYRMSNEKTVRDAKWYVSEAFWETAERQGIKTASYFWPGSEIEEEYRHPSYFEHYEHARPYNQRIDGVIEWLKLPYPERPHFITLYFDAADTYGHRYGPNSYEVDTTIAYLDGLIAELRNEIQKLEIRDSVNVIIVSDHGMTEVSPDKMVNIEKLLSDFDCIYSDEGPFMMITPQKEKEDEVYQLLKSKAANFRVYKRNAIPSYFHYSNHPFIAPIILVADIGWSLVTNKDFEWMVKSPQRGNHGYEKDHLDMHGIFFAIGPNFKNGYPTGTLWNIDIYPLLCRMYNILPRQNIDGSLERIEFILTDE